MPLANLFAVVNPDSEVDIEGLEVEDDWLWILGSHACTRAKLTKKEDDIIDLAALTALRPVPARAVLARVPLIDSGQGYALPVARDGDRIAGLIKRTTNGNRLAVALAGHPLPGRFVGTPAKEGGIDIKGIAVADDRVAVGLRGPILGGYAAILEPRSNPSARVVLKNTLVRSHHIPGDDRTVTEPNWLEGARKHYNGRVIVGGDLRAI